MSIQKKALLIVLFCVAGTLGVVATISNTIVKDSFQELENQFARESTRKVHKLLMHEIEHLLTFSEQYAAQEIIRTFYTYQDKGERQVVIAEELPFINSYNLVLFYNDDGGFVYGHYRDSQSLKKSELPDNWLEPMSPGHDFFIPRDKRGRAAGLIKLQSSEAMLISSHPVFNANDENHPPGTALFGVLLNLNELYDLVNISNMSLELLDFDLVSRQGEAAGFYKSLIVRPPYQVHVSGDNAINGYLLLNDVRGQPAYVLKVALPRDIYHQGMATLEYYNKLLLIVGVVIVLIMLLLMNQLVLLRLKRLGSGIRSVQDTRDPKLHIHMDGNDEFKYLAESFNELLDGLHASRVELEKEVKERINVEQEIRKSHELYDQAEFLGKIGYWEWDEKKDCLLSCSEQFARIYEMSVDDVIADFSSFVRRLERVHQQDRPLFQQVTSKAREENEEIDIIYRITTDSGDIRYVHQIGKFVCDQSGRIVRSLGTLQDITRQKQAQEKLALYQKKLKLIMSELALVEEQERRRISVALHDSTIQNLGLSKFKLAVFKSSLPENVSTKVLDEVTSTIEKAIDDTRNLIFELSPPILYELGFTPAIEWLAENFYEERGIVCEVYDDGKSKELDDAIMVLLFQIVRELLVNVAKHSGATRTKIFIDRVDNQIRIQIQDNGNGFDMATIFEAAPSHQGFGIFSIRERLDNIGEKLNIVSTPGEGTQISFSAPLKLHEEVSA